MQSNWDGSVRAKKIYTIISSIVVVAAAAAAAVAFVVSQAAVICSGLIAFTDSRYTLKYYSLPAVGQSRADSIGCAALPEGRRPICDSAGDSSRSLHSHVSH